MENSTSKGSVQSLATPPSHELHAFCRTGDLKSARSFFETRLPSLRPEQRIPYCFHGAPHCHNTTCPSMVATLCETAARSSQTNIFTYLWDSFLSTSEDGATVIGIPWPCLHAAAVRGSLSLAEAFFNRDPDCFKAVMPAAPHGPKGGTSQITIAIRNGRFDYIDYMLAHGADINMGFHERNILKGVMRNAVDDATCLRRICFLVERGATVAGSGALEAAIEEDRVSVVSYLLSNSDACAANHKVSLPDHTSSIGNDAAP